MTTTINIIAGKADVVATTVLHGAKDIETPQTIKAGERASLPIHNTLSLRVEGAGKVEVKASDWPVEVVQDGAKGVIRVEPGAEHELTLSAGKTLTIREGQPVVADAAEG